MTVATGHAADTLGLSDTESATIAVGGATGVRAIRRFAFQNRVNFGSLAGGFENTQGPSLTLTDPFFNSPPGPVTVANTFTMMRNASILGFRYYKHPGMTGTVPYRMWDASANVLASGNLPGTLVTDGGGWITVMFSSPVAVLANSEYSIGIYSAGNNYAWAPWVWAAQDTVYYPFTFKVMADIGGTRSDGSGAAAGSGIAFPTARKSADYYIDPLAEWTDDMPGYSGGTSWYSQFETAGSSFAFPVAVWWPEASDYAAYKALGVNTIMAGPPDQDKADAIKAQSMDWYPSLHTDRGGGDVSAVVMTQEDTALQPHIRGYHLTDEPDLGTPWNSPAVVRGWANAARARDSSRPLIVGLSYLPVKNQSFAAQPPGAGPQSWNQIWRDYAAISDVPQCDFYTLAGGSDSYAPSAQELLGTSYGKYGLWAYPRQIGRMRELSDNTKPVWGIVEATSEIPDEPAPETVRRAVWAQLIAGARGILFFNHRFGSANVTQDFSTIIHDSAMGTMVTALSARLQTLGPALHAAEAGLVESYTSSGAMVAAQGGYAPGAPIPVHYTSRIAGGISYIFAQVIRSGATTATFFVPSLAGATLTVIGESRTITVDGTGHFSDTFTADYEVHLYNTSAIPSFSMPVNTVAPSIATDGTPATGETVSCSTGSWSGIPTPTFTFQWQRNGSDIAATGPTYVLQVADEGQSVRCVVTATNAQGSASANSNTITPAGASGGSTVHRDEVLAHTPIAYWQLADLSDATGNGHVLTQSGSPTPAASLIASDPGSGKAKKFNQGTDALSAANDSALNPTSFSIECWFKYSAANLVMVTKGTTRLETGSSNDLKFNFDLAAGGTMFGLSASGVLTAGQIYHAVLTYDGTTAKMYLNATQVFTTTFAGALKSNTEPVRIGAGIGSDLPWNDVLDEVAYYGHGLSAVDVDDIYTAATTGVGGSGASAPVNTVAPAITTDGTPSTGETVSCSVGTWTGVPTPTFTRQWQRNTTNISGATSASYVLVTADEGQSIRCVVTATNTEGTVSANSNTITPSGPPASTDYHDAVMADSPIGYWQLSDLTDSSGNGHTLTQSGTPTSVASLVPTDPGANKAKDFNQGTDELSVANTSVLNPTTFSLETSFKYSAPDLVMVTKGTTRIQSGGSDQVRFNFDLAGATSMFGASTAGSLTSGQTYHTVLTYDGATVKLYLNGTEVVSIDFSGTLATNTDPFRIGAGRPGSDFPWNDVLDEVAYYDHALTPTRVAAHYAAWSVGSGSGGGTGQTAVVLAPIDGETLTGDVQSNWDDNGFFTRNGFTRATAWTGPKPGASTFAGFDDPAFIPVGIWAADFSQTSGNYDRLDDVAVNGFFPASGAVDLTMAVARGKWATVPNGDWPGGTISNAEDPAVVGVIGGEEPSTVAEFNTINSNAATWLATSDGTGRFQQTNFADNLLNGDIENTLTPADMVDVGSYTNCDQYWFAGSPASLDISRTKLHSRLYAPAAGSATAAQCARGSHYGSMMDSIRKQFPTTADVHPVGAWIEASAPYTETASLAITPAQLKWAVWSTLVHGARGIHYFVHDFRTGDTWGNPPWDNHFGGPGVAGTGVYAAMKEVNQRAVAIAAVLNSPFDGYFVYGDTESSGSIADAGFLTAVSSTNARSKYGGVDASCRWHPVEEKHYILSTTREADGSTNWPVTFRMVDQGQTTAVEIHEDNPITIVRGGSIPDGFCEFSDTFATAASYKCYRID